MLRTGIGIVFWLWAAAAAAAQAYDIIPAEVVRHPGGPGVLAERWIWALKEAAGRGYGRGFWIGYSIRRLMGENSFIGSWSHDGKSREITVEEILTGKPRPKSLEEGREAIRRTAKEILEDLEHSEKNEQKVWRDIALFFRFGAGKPPVLEKAGMSNLNLSFDFHGLPLVWAGEAADGESLDLVEDLFGKAGTDKLKESLVAAAGIHGDSSLVVPFLAGILAGGDSDHVRKDAAFWIGQQNDRKGLEILVRAAGSDRSAAVRKNAVFSISQVELPEAADEIISLARKAGDSDVRKEAIFWLSQIASRKAGPALEKFAYEDADYRVREQAVFALSQLPDNQGVEPLIKIVKTHPDSRIRKKAVFWLGECKDPRALDTLIEIVKGK